MWGMAPRQAAGNGFDAQARRAQPSSVGCQLAGDAGTGVDELQFLDPDLPALRALNLTVLDLQEDCEVTEVEISNELTRVGVDGTVRCPAGVADGRGTADSADQSGCSRPGFE